MAENPMVVSLRTRRNDLERAIGAYEKKIAAAERDLAHVNAVIHMFENGSDREVFPIGMDIRRVFKNMEAGNLCKQALAEYPEGLDTREIALFIMKVKGLDQNDTVLRRSITYKISQSMKMQERRGRVFRIVGKKKGVLVWRLLEGATQSRASRSYD